jgi:glycerophosphoryl diester phosphodiesterase
MTAPLRLAHRGDWRRAPENSLAAMVAALAIPACDGLEFDVRSAADGTPVLLHDDTLARVQGRPERVDELTAAQLADLGVPTLADVLLAAPRAAFLDIELKGELGPEVVPTIAAGRGPELRNAIVSSFEPDTLERLRRLVPAWPRWLNAEDLGPATIDIAVSLECRAVSVDWRAISPRALDQARTAGLAVAAWTVRRRSTFERLANLGVIAMCVEATALDG